MFQILENRFTDDQLLHFLDEDSFYANHYRKSSRKMSELDESELSDWLDELHDLHDSIHVDFDGDHVRLRFDEVINYYSYDIKNHLFEQIGDMPVGFLFDELPEDNCFSVLMTTYPLHKDATLVDLEAIFLMFERVISRLKIQNEDLLNVG